MSALSALQSFDGDAHHECFENPLKTPDSNQIFTIFFLHTHRICTTWAKILLSWIERSCSYKSSSACSIWRARIRCSSESGLKKSGLQISSTVNFNRTGIAIKHVEIWKRLQTVVWHLLAMTKTALTITIQFGISYVWCWAGLWCAGSFDHIVIIVNIFIQIIVIIDALEKISLFNVIVWRTFFGMFGGQRWFSCDWLRRGLRCIVRFRRKKVWPPIIIVPFYTVYLRPQPMLFRIFTIHINTTSIQRSLTFWSIQWIVVERDVIVRG